MEAGRHPGDMRTMNEGCRSPCSDLLPHGHSGRGPLALRAQPDRLAASAHCPHPSGLREPLAETVARSGGPHSTPVAGRPA